MKLLIESEDNRRSFNGGAYAKGYAIKPTSDGCVVVVDRCFGSDFEGEYLHEYHMPCNHLVGEMIVTQNPEVFAGMFSHAKIKELCGTYSAAQGV